MPAHIDPSVRAVFFMAYTVRSGSNLLCDYLSQLGIGQPTEFFQPPFGITNSWFYQEVQVAPDNFAAFLPALTQRFSLNGIFGAKLGWAHRNALEHAVAQTFGYPSLKEAFNPLWIRITRQDRIAQAISVWRALHSQVWLRRRGEASSELYNPPYEYDSLKKALMEVLSVEYVWSEYFRRHGIEPISLTYEELAADPVAMVRRVADPILARAGMGPLPKDVTLTHNLEVQRDAYSAEVYDRFNFDLYHVGIPGYEQL
jgi:trehalose 2-sulfotransferase